MARRVSLCGHDHHRDRRHAALFFTSDTHWALDRGEWICVNYMNSFFFFFPAHIPITHPFARLTRLDHSSFFLKRMTQALRVPLPYSALFFFCYHYPLSFHLVVKTQESRRNVHIHTTPTQESQYLSECSKVACTHCFMILRGKLTPFSTID